MIIFFNRKQLKDDKTLLQAAEQFQANGFNHETQKDGVSCGVHLIEVISSLKDLMKN